MAEEISHEGIVKRITEDTITVGFVNKSACASCHAKGACSASDMQDKEVEVRRTAKEYRVGERVMIVGKTSQGFVALLWGYVFPLLLVLAVLIGSISLGKEEGFSALVALGSLVPYYIIVYLLRDRLKSKLEFVIKSI
ncbi:MAG: SoxR reducing system RseC family protein [Mangrovibacterium sp.]